MSLNETSTLIAESRKIVESDSLDPNAVLNMILKIVTNIDKKIEVMESKMVKNINELKSETLAISGRVRRLEGQTSEIAKKVTECESSCQGVSNLFDKLDRQIKLNARNIILQDARIKTLENGAKTSRHQVSNVNTENLSERITNLERQKNMGNYDASGSNPETINRLKESVIDLQCRSMKNNLIFTNLEEQVTEDVELKLRQFIYEQLGIGHKIEFGNVHRFGKRNNNRPRPIVARFIYHKDLRLVLENATWLKNTPYGIHEQFPKSVEDNRRKLYPVMKDAKRQGKNAILVRDKLFINGTQYIPNTSENNTPEVRLYGYRDSLLRTPKQAERPFKRQHLSDSSPVIPPITETHS